MDLLFGDVIYFLLPELSVRQLEFGLKFGEFFVESEVYFVAFLVLVEDLLFNHLHFSDYLILLLLFKCLFFGLLDFFVLRLLLRAQLIDGLLEH